MPFDNSFLVDTLKNSKENPRYSQESEQVNFFYELSMDSSCYDEETGDAGEWIRHAVLFRFPKEEAAWLEEHDLLGFALLKEDGSLEIGYSVDDCGFPSVVSLEEYRSIEQAYNLAMDERDEEESNDEEDDQDEEEPSQLCEACNAEKFSDDRFCNGETCAKSTFEKTKTLQAGCVAAYFCECCKETDSEPVRMPSGADWCIGCANEAGFDVSDYSGYVFEANGEVK